VNGRVQTNDSRYEWIEVTDSAAFPPRDGAGALVFKGKMWLIGGWRPTDKQYYPRMCANDVWFSEDGIDWQELPGTPWAPHHAASVFVHDDSLWMVTGNNLESDVWRLVKTSA